MHKACLVSMSYFLEFPKITALTYDSVKIISYNIVTNMKKITVRSAIASIRNADGKLTLMYLSSYSCFCVALQKSKVMTSFRPPPPMVFPGGATVLNILLSGGLLCCMI